MGLLELNLATFVKGFFNLIKDLLVRIIFLCTSELFSYDCFVFSVTEDSSDLEFFLCFTGPFCFPFLYPLTCDYGCSSLSSPEFSIIFIQRK